MSKTYIRMKLLIIEDQRALSDNIAKFLSSQDYICEQAFTRNEAMVKADLYDYECILLDLMLPDGNGMDILRWMKLNKPQTGVIIVSAKDATDDIVEGLKIGADDYISKPFNLSELAMRIFALIRRRNFQASNTLSEGDLSIDLSQKDVSIKGTHVELTKSEYELLLFLLGNKGKVISKSAIAEHLTGDMADMMDNFNFVFAHMKNLKKKLAAAGLTDHIKTLYGTGYKWIS